MGIQEVMCALAIEILLKSFHAEVTGNHGKLNETYGFKKSETLSGKARAHDLKVLYDALPEKIKQYLFNSGDLNILESDKDLFTLSRYSYESGAKSSHSNGIIKLAACCICKVIFLYKQLGCTDPFIKHFDIDDLYFSDVQLVFLA
jgi:hypothetical protein